MDAPASPALGWYPDPSGRHQLRYWDGSVWTAHVSNGGVAGVDDPNRPAAPPVAPPPSYGYGSAPSGYGQGPSGYHPVPQAPFPAGSQWATGQATIAPPPPGTTWAPNSYPQPHAPAGAPPLAELSQRFWGNLLDGVLLFATLLVGWIIWSCFTFSKGQTPAKQLMGLRVVKQDTGVAANWGEMFLRCLVLPWAATFFLFGIPNIVSACMIFDGTLRRTLWDRMIGTVVVNDPQGVTVPAGY